MVFVTNKIFRLIFEHCNYKMKIKFAKTFAFEIEKKRKNLK